MIIIDFRHDFNLQAKKYDFVKIAYILSKLQEPTKANTINYYFNQIFPNKYCNALRISQIMRQKKNLFSIYGVEAGMTRQTKNYTFKGKLLLNKTTKLNWDNKSKKFFQTP